MIEDLIVRVLTGHATPDERTQVEAWRMASDANARMFADLERVLRDVAAWYEDVDAPPPPSAAELLRRAEMRDVASPTRLARSRRRRRHWYARPSAMLRIAAALLITFGAGAAVAAWRVWRAPALGAVFVEAAATGITPVLLSDGTAVQLAAGSRLRASPRRDRREVTLEGRAEFTVMHMARLPFVVRTAAGEARDVGTRFVVRTDERGMDVAVFEGRVALTADGASIDLAAGDVGRAVSGQAPWRTSQHDARSDDDWLRASLVFNGDRLTDVANTLEDRYHYHLHIADTSVAHRRVSAWFVDPPAPRDAVVAICRAIAASCDVGDSSATVSARMP